MAVLWTTDLNTEIDIIDEQHKRIVDYINELELAKQRQDAVAVGRVLDELVDYTLSHFAFEESLQSEAGYEFATPHKATHEMFIKRIGTYQERHKAGEDIAEQLYTMLGTWLIHHIKRDDMAYVSAVRESMERIIENKKEGGWLSRSLGKFFR